VLDASECPPTFGSDPRIVQGVIAGGPTALVSAVEGAEDRSEEGERAIEELAVDARDTVIGIAASRRTPYVVAALAAARRRGARTAYVTCTPREEFTLDVDVAICPEVGPEVLMGSTRMKAGTAQKLVLNMISTAAMIRIGMTYSNWMINVQMSNAKLQERGIQILREILGVNAEQARKLTEASGGKLKLAVIMGTLGCSRKEAEQRLSDGAGNLRKVLGHLGAGRE
jgi:N-acetylmuramic acid 6-phosphate etherase